MRRWLRSQKSRKFPWTTPFVAGTENRSSRYCDRKRTWSATHQCRISNAAKRRCKGFQLVVMPPPIVMPPPSAIASPSNKFGPSQSAVRALRFRPNGAKCDSLGQRPRKDLHRRQSPNWAKPTALRRVFSPRWGLFLLAGNVIPGRYPGLSPYGPLARNRIARDMGLWGGITL